MLKIENPLELFTVLTDFFYTLKSNLDIIESPQNKIKGGLFICIKIISQDKQL